VNGAVLEALCWWGESIKETTQVKGEWTCTDYFAAAI